MQALCLPLKYEAMRKGWSTKRILQSLCQMLSSTTQCNATLWLICTSQHKSKKLNVWLASILLDEWNPTEWTSTVLVSRWGKRFWNQNTAAITLYKPEFCVTLHMCMSWRFISATFKVSTLCFNRNIFNAQCRWICCLVQKKNTKVEIFKRRTHRVAHVFHNTQHHCLNKQKEY